MTVPGIEIVLDAKDPLVESLSLITMLPILPMFPMFPMLPALVSGTVLRLRRRAADPRFGLTVGITAAVCSPPGAVLARLVEPQVRTCLFAARRTAPRSDATVGTGA